MFLLDTNVLAEPTKPSPNQFVLDQLRQHAGQLRTSAVVWQELLFGVNRLPPSRKRVFLEQYLREVVSAGITVLPYDERAAIWHADERVRLQRQGWIPPFSDGQIAATAAVNGLVLVTQNTKDFARFEGLVMTDWMRS